MKPLVRRLNKLKSISVIVLSASGSIVFLYHIIARESWVMNAVTIPAMIGVVASFIGVIVTSVALIVHNVRAERRLKELIEEKRQKRSAEPG